MGAADLVPGVSGGTIAFITGIYARLLAALAAFAEPALWRDALRLDIPACWRRADGGFLLALLSGVLLAIVLLSGILHELLETRAHALLGFFFGLVVASVFSVRRQLGRVGASHLVLFAVACAATLWFVSAVPAVVGDAPGGAALFFGGMAAIGAMLLPGISGSYVLLILGMYPTVVAAVHERDFAVVALFAAGCGVGALVFSRLFVVLLARYKTPMVAVLLGVMLGALPKLWPWKENAEGAKIILQQNVLPADFAGAPEIGLVVALAVAGALLVLAIERLAVPDASAAR